VSVKLPYKKFPDGKGGFDSFAVVPVNIARPEPHSPRSKRFEAIIDSGACRCTFHSSIGAAVGLDIEKGKEDATIGVSGKPTKIWLHDISLYTPGGIIAIQAAFAHDLPVAGILGMSGFFGHFRITFDPTAQRCELERIYQA